MSEHHHHSDIARILKFGGSSVQTPERILAVFEILRRTYAGPEKMAVVVSAFGGVTDQLIALGKTAASGDNKYHIALFELLERHKSAAHKLISKESILFVLEQLDKIFIELYEVLEGVYLVKELSLKTLDFVMSFGERLSAFIMAIALQSFIPQAIFLDAREFIKTNRTFGGARVDFEATNNNIHSYFSCFQGLPIITGFIGSSKDNETTTLGRGGSDYTAAIFGAALKVKLIEIWTDVDGVMTADPKKEPYAFPIPEMSYKEAMEMSYFGAKVINPPTISPALKYNIPLLIKNSFNSEAQGTLISKSPSKSQSQICGISSIDHIALLSLQGTGIVGVCGISKRLFGALAEKGINIILISQASSEHSICFAISPHYADMAKEAIEKEFELEIRANLIDEVTSVQNLSIVAVVGENMCKSPGVSGKLFNALGKNGINVIAIAQGSSELNITVVIRKEDKVKSIRTLHEAFFLSPKKTMNVFLVGVGIIGRTLLAQLKQHAPNLCDEYALDIRIAGIANSRSMAFYPPGFQWNDVDAALEGEAAEKMHVKAYIDKMRQQNLINISTLNELILSGDKIHKIEAILSGTLSYLFNTYSEDKPFSELVQEAHNKGYTEPDPREDLNGMDVARKLLILARESNYPLEVEDIEVKSFLPDDCFKAHSVREFYEHLKLQDALLEAERKKAAQAGKLLRYIAKLENGKGLVSLQAIGPEHPFYHLSGNDNIISITSGFYRENPLVIKGQGAGASVTAGKVLADIIRLGLDFLP